MLRGDHQTSPAQSGTAGRHGASLVWPVLGDVGRTVLSALEAAPHLGTGELVTDGAGAGRIFLHDGHIAWVAGDDRVRLTDVLLRRTTIAADVLADAHRLCQVVGRNLAEVLVERGLVSKQAVRDALLEHNANQLSRLLHMPMTSLRFTPARRRYASDLLFQVDELIGFVPPDSDTDNVVVLVPSSPRARLFVVPPTSARR